MTKKAVLLLHLMVISPFLLGMSELEDSRVAYPIVLIHGLCGFGHSFAFIISYWGQIPDLLKKNGAEVFIAEVSQAHDVETRGEQLCQQLKKWGRKKYNLVGHSFGGLDARYVQGKHGELVASVTTIGTPHEGSKIADLIYTCINAVPLSSFFWRAGNMACHAIALLSGNIHRQDLKKAMNRLTTKGMQDFNENFCKEPLTEEGSCAFYSCGSCAIEPQGIFDVFGISLHILGFLFYGRAENDGLVDKNSMTFGCWVGAIKGGHHIMPIKGGLGRHKKDLEVSFENLLLEHVERLKSKGY